MDEQREDYFDYDSPPEHDLPSLWRAACAISGLLVIVALAAIVAVVFLSAFDKPPVAVD